MKVSVAIERCLAGALIYANTGALFSGVQVSCCIHVLLP